MAIFRIEKTKNYTVMSNHHLRNTSMSLKAKGLLSLMLSLPDNWDYTTKGLAAICRDGIDSICNAVKELENLGYVERKRQRNSAGHLKTIEYTIFEEPRKPKPENPVLVEPKPENPILDNPILGKPILENPAQLSTNILNTKELNTESINLSKAKDMSKAVEMDKIDKNREEIKESLDYELMCINFGEERAGEVIEIILDIFASNSRYIKIGRGEYASELVKQRMSSLRYAHIEYVFLCMSQQKKEIKNIKAYLLSALYNAPATIDAFYSQKVQADNWRC